MTKRKIQISANKIAQLKKDGLALEALISTYHLNLQIVRLLLESSLPNISLQNKKAKEILALFTMELETNSSLKSLIPKRNSKPVKIWFKQMDVFFKALKFEIPKNLHNLQSQGDAVVQLLNLSANKLHAKKQV